MYFLTNERLGEPPTCDPAEHSLERLAGSLKMFKKETDKSYPDTTRLKRLGTLVGMDADSLKANLADFIDSGCCEPELQTLEAQVQALPWVFQKQRGRGNIVRIERYSNIIGAHRELIKAIKQAQGTAATKCAPATP